MRLALPVSRHLSGRRSLAKFAMAGAMALCLGGAPVLAQTTLLNVSYDPTRELYKDFNKAFAAYYQQSTGQTLTVTASHGGSGAQARAVLNGQPADVVTLGLAPDIDQLAKAGLLNANWQARLPDNSTPYTSTIVFLVRKGNPKAIKDWGDLVKNGVSVITPNPKTSGGARWNYLAAYGWALHQKGGTDKSAIAFLTQLYQHVPVLDSGARGATNSFVQRGLGDVLIAWENEALLATKDVGNGQFDIVYPSETILAEPPVAVVDKVVDSKGTRAAAEAYLQYLYTPAGQEIVAKHYFRPRDISAQAKYAAQFPAVKTFTVADLGGWSKLVGNFTDGGTFDQIYQGKKE
jgi:sulfate/thiosulfate transport system substrate-binding protein